MTRRKAWGLAAAVFVAGGAPAFTVVAVQGDGTPGVTVGEARPEASQVLETRAELVDAWTAGLEQVGRELPENWEVLTTHEIRGRYPHQRMVNAPSAEDIDPGMGRRADG